MNALWAVADVAAVQVKGMLSSQHDARLEHEVMSCLLYTSDAADE